MKKIIFIIAMIAIVASCAKTGEQSKSIEDLETFLEKVEKQNIEEGPIISSASWISSNFITYDSQKVIADYSKRYSINSLERAREASLFNNFETTKDNRRKLELLKSSFVMPPPLDESLAKE